MQANAVGKLAGAYLNISGNLMLWAFELKMLEAR